MLAVTGLVTEFRQQSNVVRAVDGVSFQVEPHKTLCLVGESGCGKSAAAMSLLGLIEPPGKVVEGSVRLDGRELLSLSDEELRDVRGKDLALIFQNSRFSLHPTLTVGLQLTETILSHRDLSKSAARDMAVDLLRRMRMPRPDRAMKQYPFEMSGGMRQRVMIAMALLLRPRYIIADEPTSSLDVTTQSHILDEMMELQSELGMGILFITHDLSVVAEIADVVAVMRKGRIVETGTVYEMFSCPQNPYSRELLASR